MPLTIYNTLSRSKEEFHPIDPDLVRMYVCGPTVYGHMHIGHAKSYVSFDIVRRWLMHRYGQEGVLYVMNITDVGHLVGDGEEGEDKVEAQARRENRSPYEIAAYYEESFWDDMKDLNSLMPDRIPHATDFIRQQIKMTEELIAKGVAYESNGSVYFDVNAYQQQEKAEGMIPYGGLSNRKVEDQTGGERIEANPEKKNPQDFALWKRADEIHFMQWYSPWGWGYPGWHLECSVMSSFYLGKTFDIHGGGIENQFPHHECEIAQSQAVNDAPFVRYWMHHNMVNVSGQKMGKSLGNASNVKELIAEVGAMALRFFIAQSHYRSPLEYDPDAIVAAGSGFERLRGTITRLREVIGSDLETRVAGIDANPEVKEVFDKFSAAMDDDFNTPVAIGYLFEGVSNLNKLLAANSQDRSLLEAYNSLFTIAFEQVLGMDFSAEDGRGGALADDLMRLIIDLRANARETKDFATADQIRDALKDAGVVLEDGKDGTRWGMTSS
ncbi:MAG: cysteine--tRNA ligase [Ignavibacteriae bacterium]|nr:cysteine--tRNA ligase [Ignavibacteriota bacterium]MCB9216502.1 cysteine--tRNA ligase [Ignavibacteria bacterium]